jgi:hypothetical protein
MPLATDTSLNFNVTTGYTFDAAKTEFTGGVCRLKAAAGITTDTVITPDVDRAAWVDPGGGTAIHKAALTYVELVGYTHRFVASYDGGRTYRSYNAGGWFEARLADIGTVGISPSGLEEVREWSAGSTIRFAVWLSRTVGAVLGSIDQITLHYGNVITAYTADTGADAWPADPDNAGATLVPHFPGERRARHPHAVHVSGMGYRHAIALARLERDVWSLEWKALSTAQKDTLKTFIGNHHQKHVTWTPPGEASARRFVLGDPAFDHDGPSGRAWGVRCPAVQAFAGEEPTV